MRIAIIIGSTRPNRNGESVGKWFMNSQITETMQNLSLSISRILICHFLTSRYHLQWGNILTLIQKSGRKQFHLLMRMFL